MKPKDLDDDIIRGIAFDISKTRTGVSTWEDQRCTGVYSHEFSDAVDIGHLLFMWRHALVDIIPAVGIGWVAFEDVKPVNKNHSEIHFGMTGLLAEICYRREIPLIRPTATQVKKTLAGSGKATKEEMILSARYMYPFLNVQNNDEADAVGVGLYAISIIEWDKPMTEQVTQRTPF